MKRNWLTRTLIVMLTLAMVVGIMAIKPREAKAEVASLSISPSGTINISQNVGSSVTFTANAALAAGSAGTITYTWSVESGSALSYSSASGTTGTFTVAAVGDTATVKCVAHDSTDADDSKDKTATAVVKTLAFGIANTPNPAAMSLGDVIQLSTKNLPSGSSVAWSSSANDVVSVDSNGKITALKGATGTTTITATMTAPSGETAQDPATFTVSSVSKKTGAITFKDNPIVTGISTSINLDSYINKTHDQATEWQLSGTIPSGVSLSGSTLTLGSTTGTFTVTASCPESATYSAVSPVSATVNVRAAASFTPSATSLSISPYNASTTVTMTSTPSNGTITAQSLDSSIATVSGSGTGTGTFTVQGVKTGNTYIRFRNSEGTGYVDIPVKVGNPTPKITAYFNPDDYNMNKSTGYITLHIHVDNPQSNYVTIKRSNIRTYATGYDTHDSTYYYTHYLDADGDARFNIYPQYNGTTYYTVSATGASSVQTHNLTISGYTTMPQTGPDYTWVYILSGLCVAALAAAVTLNARKKKHQEN